MNVKETQRFKSAKSRKDDYKKAALGVGSGSGSEKEYYLLLQMISDVNRKVDDLDNKSEAAHTALNKKIEATHAAINKKLDTREKETTDLKRRVTRLEAARVNHPNTSIHTRSNEGILNLPPISNSWQKNKSL